jgi:NTP pyrophosphatase (non-canonical NTP hydrolase)
MLAAEYQRAARTTAIYPAAAGVYYPALGLAGELGELCNKAKKIIRGDVTFEQRVDDFKKELGDVLWYVAALASDVGLDLTSIVREALDGDQLTGDLYATLLDAQCHVSGIAFAATMIRTKGIAEDHRNAIRVGLMFLMRSVARLCALFGVELPDVCKNNIKKLFKRKESGTIRGDGDNR